MCRTNIRGCAICIHVMARDVAYTFSEVVEKHKQEKKVPLPKEITWTKFLKQSFIQKSMVFVYEFAD
jgi:hypothetical protein